ncbi:putative oxidoreductase [Aspergillus ibericus CBS 121593]|uniref:Putative oxidoreductase n=1 Tax=Aspergillus ibericus CBS 121593 TaxID=1448316 RepID=A0A395GSY4_9EURO|nr:putative oxidoreductase [Aspergillus ibericus CBS 121593]RAK98068.1 putative oxidoreductase [Aspergillus ibericus CBS 121593]
MTPQEPYPAINENRNTQPLGNSDLGVPRLILNWRIYDDPSREGISRALPDPEILHLLKNAYDRGITTWDITDCCAGGMAEILIGRALAQYKIPRTSITIMTKLCHPVLKPPSLPQAGPAGDTAARGNRMKLSHRNIFEAVEGSLIRLNTTYIDVLHLNYMDDTEPEEVMEALHNLVQAGKVLYLGAANMLCWQLARLQHTARMRNWTTFTWMQGPYNLLYREGEREIHPFCQAEGINLISWSPRANGLLDGLGNFPIRGLAPFKFSAEQNHKILMRARWIAQSKGCSMRTVAIAWLLAKGVSPSVGLQNIDKSTLMALEIRLTDQEVKFLDELYRGLPMDVLQLDE